MTHVPWWLFGASYWLLGLSFIAGLVFTFALTVRPERRQVPVEANRAGSGPGTRSEPQLTEAPVADEFFTTSVAAKIESQAPVFPVDHDAPTMENTVGGGQTTAF